MNGSNQTGIINDMLIKQFYCRDEHGIWVSGNHGYWSNLSKLENKAFINLLKSEGHKSAVTKVIPHLEEMIYSERREAALELLDKKDNGVCIDYGCMWGVLSVGMAKRGYHVIAFDQTYDSLRFLSERVKQEKIANIYLIQDDIREVQLKDIADYAIVNGVLEWVAEQGDIEISNYYGKKAKKNYKGEDSPDLVQFRFLNTVYNSLKKGGQLLLAIENRYDYSQFIGKKDPHSNLYFTSILPRFFANLISRLSLGRPYRNYLYSFRDMEKLLESVGFNSVKLYMAFPNYHFPELIFPYTKEGIKEYNRYGNPHRVTKKQKIAYGFEYIIMKYLRMRYFAPAIIAVAEK